MVCIKLWPTQGDCALFRGDVPLLKRRRDLASSLKRAAFSPPPRKRHSCCQPASQQDKTKHFPKRAWMESLLFQFLSFIYLYIFLNPVNGPFVLKWWLQFGESIRQESWTSSAEQVGFLSKINQCRLTMFASLDFSKRDCRQNCFRSALLCLSLGVWVSYGSNPGKCFGISSKKANHPWF